MPGEQLFGGVGVDLLYPSAMGGPMANSFSEPEWNSSHIAPLPADFEQSYGHNNNNNSSDSNGANNTPVLRPPPIEVSPLPPHMLNIPRPKSSPSTFGAPVDDLLFADNPYKLHRTEEYPSFNFPMSPAKTSSPYFTHEYSVSARTSPVRHHPIPIAPDPVGLQHLNNMRKRTLPQDEDLEYGMRKQRKRAPSNAGPVELNEEETLLLKLKEEENLPWKDIAVRFQTDLGKSYQVPALQMRFKRLRERMRTWTDTDISALEQAYDYWGKFQFDIISAKMLDFGSAERWPAKYCARKWEELHPGRVPFPPAPHFLPDPWGPPPEQIGAEEALGGPTPRTSFSRSPRQSISHSPQPSIEL